MRITAKNLAEWDSRGYRRLRRATLSGGWLKSYMTIFPNAMTIVIFNEKQMMAWAFCAQADDTVYLQMFVNPRYRGKQLGTRLVEEALLRFPSITLAEWDATTRHLFRKLRDKHPGKIHTYAYTWQEEARKFQRLKTAQAQTASGSMEQSM